MRDPKEVLLERDKKYEKEQAYFESLKYDSPVCKKRRLKKRKLKKLNKEYYV